MVSRGARGPGGAKCPGDVCSAPTEVERRPSVLRGPERERRPNPSLAIKTEKSLHYLENWGMLNLSEVYWMNQTGIKQKVLQEIIELAIQYNLDKVVLFGSRARGDYRYASDIDLAVWGGDVTRFALDVEEETSTLLKFDIVDMSAPVQPELIQSIEQEGKVLYEKV